MKISYQCKTNEDRLGDLEVRLGKVLYDLDSPEWYWLRREWVQLGIDEVATRASIKRVGKLVDEELVDLQELLW